MKSNTYLQVIRADDEWKSEWGSRKGDWKGCSWGQAPPHLLERTAFRPGPGRQGSASRFAPCDCCGMLGWPKRKSWFMRVYYLTGAQFALSNLALRRIKIARFEDLNDPFEVLGVDVRDMKLRAAVARDKKENQREQGAHLLQQVVAQSAYVGSLCREAHGHVFGIRYSRQPTRSSHLRKAPAQDRD